jgi:hypothetical protein
MHPRLCRFPQQSQIAAQSLTRETCAMNELSPADRFAPRAQLVRSLILVELTASELYRLIRSLEAEAVAAADIGMDDYADFLFRRVAELREAGR